MVKVRLTSRGAFKADKPKRPGQNSKDGAMPDIFKFERVQEHVLQEPKILVYNETKEWSAEWALTEAPDGIKQLLVDRNKVYMICIPGEGALQPLELISDQPW